MVEAAASDAAVALGVVQDPDLDHWTLFLQTGHHVHGQSLAVVEDLVRVPCYGEEHRHGGAETAHHGFRRVPGVDEQSHHHIYV